MDFLDENGNTEEKIDVISGGNYAGKEKVIEIMNLYNQGFKKEASDQMIKHLDYFIWYMMKKQYPTYSDNKEVRMDLYNQAVVEILKAMPKFDPRKRSPSTYFGYFILGGFHQAIEDIYDNRNSPTFKKIAKVVNKFEELGVPMSEINIAAAANASITDVKKYFSYVNAHDYVYISENPEIDMDIKQKSQTPDEEFLENEKNSKIHQAIQELPENEKRVIYTFFFTKPEGDRKKHTLDTVAEMTNLPKDLAQLSLQRGLKKLKRNPELKDYHFEKFTKYSDTVEFINHDVSAYDSIGDENDDFEGYVKVKGSQKEYILKPYDGTDDFINIKPY